MFWSDPINNSKLKTGFAENKSRQAGCLFNRVAMNNFNKVNNTNFILRSHQNNSDSSPYDEYFDEGTGTVFSATEYYDEIPGNISTISLKDEKGGIIVLKNDSKGNSEIIGFWKSEKEYFTINNVNGRKIKISIESEINITFDNEEFKIPITNKGKDGKKNNKEKSRYRIIRYKFI